MALTLGPFVLVIAFATTLFVLRSRGGIAGNLLIAGSVVAMLIGAGLILLTVTYVPPPNAGMFSGIVEELAYIPGIVLVLVSWATIATVILLRRRQSVTLSRPDGTAEESQ